MKVKYLGTFLVASVLGLSVLTACSDTTGDPNIEGDGTGEVAPDAGVTPDGGAMPDTETTPDGDVMPDTETTPDDQ